MRILVQRVSEARVCVNGESVGAIGPGLLVLAGVAPTDDEPLIRKMAEKVANLRIFKDENGKFAHSLLDMGGGALVVSQFTLFADTRKGRRPSFTAAAAPEMARELVDLFVKYLKGAGVDSVETGSFGACMSVSLCNEGPVTIWMDSEEWRT